MRAKPETLSSDQFTDLTATARILHRDRRGVQVLLTPDDRIVKLFRRRPGFSSDLLRPYAGRFVVNATRLRQLGMDSVQIERHLRCRQPRLDLVVYPKLPGNPVRELTSAEYSTALQRLPAYLAQLHAEGIYFKGLHLGNLLYRPPDRFSLIDIVNVDFSRGSLASDKRAGNLHHLCSRGEDYPALCDYGLANLLENYLAAALLGDRDRSRLLQRLQRRSVNQPELLAACQQLQKR